MKNILDEQPLVIEQPKETTKTDTPETPPATVVNKPNTGALVVIVILLVVVVAFMVYQNFKRNENNN